MEGIQMKKILIILIFLFFCTMFESKNHQISEWKSLLVDPNDLTIIQLSNSPVGPVFTNIQRVKTINQKDINIISHFLSNNHFKLSTEKGFQHWKYVIYFHKSEGGYKEHKIQVSNSGVCYEGTYYPFKNKKIQKELFMLMDEIIENGAI